MVLTGRRVPSLLLASARLTGTGVELVLPDGDVLTGPSAHADDALSKWVGRRVALVHAETFGPGVGEYFEDATDDNSKAVSWTMPPGRFVDALPLLVLTTASLRQGRTLHPDGAWETRRFRPNIVLAMTDASAGFVETGWIGRTLAIGPEVRLHVDGPCPRCVMTTLAQSDLPRDPGVLRAAVERSGGNVGVYAAVVRGGRIQRGDELTVE